MQIIRSLPGKLLASAHLQVQPASILDALEQYWKMSFQRPAQVQLSTLAYGGFIDGSRGVLVDCLPDGDQRLFAGIRELFDDGTVLEALEASALPASLCGLLGLADCVFEKSKPLRFGCRCAPERVEAMLAAMPADDLRELLKAARPARIFCHMCGKGYEVGEDKLRLLLAGKED